MKTVLYLSPHFDDAVFSCSSHIKAQREAGNRAIVATVFTEGDHDERKQEDLAAMQILDAEHLWLGYLDAPYRDDYYNSFERIVFGDDRGFKLNLSLLVKELSPDQIIAPLGVGTHIDHRMVFDAVQRLKFTDTLYYEDKPYALIHGATALRLNQLGFKSELPAFEDFWESYLSAPYVKAYLGEEKESVRARLRRTTEPNSTRHGAEIIWNTQAVKKAINCYPTQLKTFGHDMLYLTPDLIARLTFK